LQFIAPSKLYNG